MLTTVTPERTKCKGWGHRACLGHYVQPKPGDIILLDGANFTRVSSEPGWFVMGYIGNDGRLSEVIDQHGEAFVVRWLRDGGPEPNRDFYDQPHDWEAVLLAQ